MAACMMEHDPVDGVPIPRLTLVKTYKVSMPVGCHHCQDAPCASVCPQRALYISDGTVKIRQERCIGCSSCVLVCPFGAIDIVPSTRTVQRGGFTYRAARVPVVVKCDLCASRSEGPACVQACLTDALDYVDEDQIKQITRTKRHAAVQAVELAATVA
jgi:Fe-S-cluster-containing hydrogenase component 2